MFYSSGRLLTAALLAASVLSVVGSPPVVQTRQGAVKGYIDRATDGREFFAFKGIPYARPPVGELRFKNPIPAASWEGELDATTPGAKCPQYPFTDNVASLWGRMFGEEDCLFLNVYTPNVTSTGIGGLPVMVFIHGGAWIMGNADIYPANSLLKQDVVLVVLQYRLGTLGFLSTEDDAAPGNLGLKDQGLALAWVQQNIDNFGGDPARVTIFGESAGAASVHFHLLIEQSAGLFQRAIIQSGAANCPWGITDNARSSAYKIGQHLGCAVDSDSVTSDQLIKCLQKKPLDQIVSTYSIFFEFGTFPLAMAPIVDGKYLKAHPAVLLKEGKQQKVDLIIGINKDEGAFMTSMVYTFEKLFVDLNENFNRVAPVSLSIPSNSFEPLTQAIRVYKKYFGPNIKFSDQAVEYTDMSSDRFFKVCADNAALAHLTATAGTPAQTFMYELEHRGQQSFLDFFPLQYVADQAQPKTWVSHVDELAYLFPGGEFFKPHEDDVDLEMTSKMVRLWTQFATHGNPTPDDSLGFKWEAATEGQLRHLVLQPRPFMRKDQRLMVRKFWDSYPLPENMLAHPEKFENIELEMRKVRLERTFREEREHDEL